MFHDTIYAPECYAAVVEFCRTNSHWRIKEHFTNNNGLTICERIQEEKLQSPVIPDELKETISAGNRTYGQVNVRYHESGAKLKVGKYCSFADQVVFFLGGNHRTDWVTTFPFTELFEEAKGIKGHPATKGDIEVGNDVWVGTGALILSGVHIGDGAVIGAGSIVARDIPPYSIAVGNPCRVVKKRFDDATIERLLAVKWWDWPEERVVRMLPYLLNSDIGLFLKRAESYLLRESVPDSVTPTVSVGNGQESA